MLITVMQLDDGAAVLGYVGDLAGDALRVIRHLPHLAGKLNDICR